MGLEDAFPVAENDVPRLHVSAARMDAWKEVAQDEIMRALSHRHSWYNAFKDRVRDGFDMIADRPNLKAFVRPVVNTSDKDILIRSTLEGVHLDELVAGMYCDTTYDVRCAFAHLYEANFLDGAILQSYETRTDEDPMHFVGVRWIAFRSPAPAIMTSRDFLFFSYEGTAYDVDGNRVLFRFLRSMPMDDIEIDKSKLPPLVTGKISNLHFYRQNGSRVDAFTKAMHSNAGNMPAWVVTKTISFMFPGISNVETICDARALLANGTAKLNPGRLCPLPGTGSGSGSGSNSSSSSSRHSNLVMGHVTVLATANACGVCFHKFKFTRAKRRCQGCIREVCKRCTKRMFFFDELKHIADTGVVALRFCLNCTRLARADVREANAYRASFSTRRSSGSAGSTSRQYLLQQQQHQHGHRRVPSGSSGTHSYSHHSSYEPEVEPPYVDSYTSTSYDHDDSDDDDSQSYSGYDVHGLTTASASSHEHYQDQSYQDHYQQPNATGRLPLDPYQLQQLQTLQEQHHYDAHDHEEFLRLYGEYAARHEKQQRQGKLISIDQLGRNQLHGGHPPMPPSHRQHANNGNRRRVRSTDHVHGGGGMPSHPSAMHMHMIPPMPQPDGLPRSHTMATRTTSEPNLYAHGEHRAAPPHLPQSRASAPLPPVNASASEDLETIFRLRMLLFNGNGEIDSETMSTTSSTSSLRTAAQRNARAKTDPTHHRLQSAQLVQQRY